MKGRIASFAFAVLVGLARFSYASPSDWVLKAMAEEMERNKERLRLQGYEAPYFIAYSLRDTDRYYISGKAGAVFQSNRLRSRYIYVDVRVGDYDLDSSHDTDVFFDSTGRFVPTNLAPLDHSESALRRVLWLLTDYKYKTALVSYLKVKGKLVNDPRERRAGSLTREPPLKLVEAIPPFRFDQRKWEEGVRSISRVLLDYPDIFDSSVEVSATLLTRYIVNSEGTEVRTSDEYASIYVWAATRADDGQYLDDTVTYYVRSAQDLPEVAEVVAKTRELAERLSRLRKAKVIEPVTVPVLMSPQATGVFFHETVGHRLEGQRQEDLEEGRTFKGHLGQRVLPDFIDIIDDPTLPSFEGVALNGHYRVDDEGVRAAPAILVEEGVLKGFLMSRRPVEGFDHSNGHGRSDGYQMPLGRMATLVVRGRSPVSSERLREMLLEEVRRQSKPFGLIIETVASGSTNTSAYGYQAFKGVPKVAYRVDAETGETELVRGFEIVGTPLSSISKIIATSDRYGVFNGYCGAESGSVPVSTVAPEMLFAEIEIQRPQEVRERNPILPPPEADRDSLRGDL